MIPTLSKIKIHTFSKKILSVHKPVLSTQKKYPSWETDSHPAGQKFPCRKRSHNVKAKQTSARNSIETDYI